MTEEAGKKATEEPEKGSASDRAASPYVQQLINGGRVPQ
jgi:hypothetical protein